MEQFSQRDREYVIQNISCIFENKNATQVTTTHQQDYAEDMQKKLQLLRITDLGTGVA